MRKEIHLLDLDHHRSQPVLRPGFHRLESDDPQETNWLKFLRNFDGLQPLSGPYAQDLDVFLSNNVPGRNGIFQWAVRFGAFWSFSLTKFWDGDVWQWGRLNLPKSKG